MYGFHKLHALLGLNCPFLYILYEEILLSVELLLLFHLTAKKLSVKTCSKARLAGIAVSRTSIIAILVFRKADEFMNYTYHALKIVCEPPGRGYGSVYR